MPIAHPSFAVASLAVMAGMLVSPVRAEEASGQVQDHRFWAELGLGYGYVERSASSQTISDNSFALDVSGGLRVSPHVKVGLDLGGYNLQATCLSTPSHSCTPLETQRGKGIEHLFYEQGCGLEAMAQVLVVVGSHPPRPVL